MIELLDVTRTFPSRPAPGRKVVRALDDVRLELPAGQVSAVVGPNGAGKSTLFALVLGFLQPSAGEVGIQGVEPRRWLRRHGAAYLPDRVSLPDGWRVRPGLRALARLEGLGGAAAAGRVEAAMERFGLREHAGRRASELSRGVLQRVGLAQAALAERELVVLDEPGAALDPFWRLHLREWIRDLRSAGRTVLLASHDLGEVERVSDRVVLLEAGRVRDVMEPRELAGPLSYRVTLEPGSAVVADLLPRAREERPESGTAPRVWRLTVSDARELSDRIAAVIAAGALIHGVEPVKEPLEERVRRALATGDAPAREGPGPSAAPQRPATAGPTTGRDDPAPGGPATAEPTGRNEAGAADEEEEQR